MTTDADAAVDGLVQKVSGDSSSAEEIPVEISFEIIRLFSEGLYQSPHKAIEELVSNGFDAGALQVHIVTPRSVADDPLGIDSLWVIDDGCGMNAEGFARLWRVAESTKAQGEVVRGRPPIGQFGIASLLRMFWQGDLTHVSKREGKYYYASMDFRKVEGKRQNDPNAESVGRSPFTC